MSQFVKWSIICDDILNWCKTSDYIAHAIICDPPYHLTGGFMSKDWDKDGPDAISFQKETWAALAEHLLPGGFLFVFASSRGWHRLACALEDSGLIIQPSIFIWLNAQSFPKASRIDTKLDAKAEKSEERKVVGYKNPRDSTTAMARANSYSGFDDSNAQTGIPITKPATNLARAWEGHRYGGQILKNCAEPIIVAQKPWDKKRLDCIAETGAGALNIDDARIGTKDSLGGGGEKHCDFQGKDGWGRPWMDDPEHQASHAEKIQANVKKAERLGRWPSNFVLCHAKPKTCPACNGEGDILHDDWYEECGHCDGKGVVGGCRRVMVEEPCPVCNGRGIVETKPIAETWEEWYAKTKDYGGTREEYDRLASPGGTAFCKECKGSGKVRRVGVKRVKGSLGIRGSDEGNVMYGDGKGLQRPMTGQQVGYADPDGLETVDAFLCSENCPVAKLDEQAGERKSGARKPTGHPKYGGPSYLESSTLDTTACDASTGSASRFFMQSDWSHEVAERIAEADPVRYCPKAAKRERNQNLDDFYWRIDKSVPIGFVRIDKDEWESLGQEEERIREKTSKQVRLRARGNIHSTVKPISLCKHLSVLLSPPKEYAPRRLLVPFSGVSSEMLGALLSGNWEEIVGIDSERNYCDIGEARMKFWSAKMRETSSADPKVILKKKGTKK